MSVYYSILTAVQSSIQTVSGAPTVVIRKRPIRMDSDSLPLCIVSPDVEEIKDLQFGGGAGRGGGVWYKYWVDVVLMEAGNRIVGTGLSTWLTLRENIRNQLLQAPLPGYSTAFDMRFDPEAVLKLREFQGSNYEVTGWRCYFLTAETHE